MTVALRDDRRSSSSCRAITLYHVVDRGHARPAGTALSWRRFIEEMDILPGFREGIRNVALDEQRHIAFGVKLLADALPAGPRDGHARRQRRDPRGRPVHVGARQAAGLGRRLLPVLRLHLRASSASRACARSSSGSRRSASTSRRCRASRSRWTCRSRSARVRGTKMLKANLIGPDRPGRPRPGGGRDHVRRDAPPGGRERRQARDRDPVGLHRLRALAPDADQRAHDRQAGHARRTPTCACVSGFDDWVDVFAARARTRASSLLSRRMRPRGDLRLLLKLGKIFG